MDAEETDPSEQNLRDQGAVRTLIVKYVSNDQIIFTMGQRADNSIIWTTSEPSLIPAIERWISRGVQFLHQDEDRIIPVVVPANLPSFLKALGEDLNRQFRFRVVFKDWLVGP